MPSSPAFSRKRPNVWQDKGQLPPKAWRFRRLCSVITFPGLMILGVIVFNVDVSSYLSKRSAYPACNCTDVEDRSTHFSSRKVGRSMEVRERVQHGSDTSTSKQELLRVDPGYNQSRRSKVLGIIGVQTGFDSVERRKALRETWMPADPEGMSRLEEATGLAFRFVIGRSSDSQKMDELGKEIEKYKDFICLDIEEGNLKLAQKTLAFFKAAYMLFDADFYVKADDDIYLRTDRLATLLAKDRTSSRTYLGCMKKGPVITDSKLKWFEPLGHLLGSEYFNHADGSIYALSADVVASFAIAKNDSLRFFSNEDVTVGIWILGMNVNHEDNKALCEHRCTSTTIAIWDSPKCSGTCNAAEKVRKWHNSSKCSSSPTLPKGE